MADFCRQCSLVLFGEDFKELAKLSSEADTANKMYPVVICEGCGPIQVDYEGQCVSEDCMVDHETGQLRPPPGKGRDANP